MVLPVSCIILNCVWVGSFVNGSRLIEIVVAGWVESLKGGNASVLIQPGVWMFTVRLSLTNLVLLHGQENSLI